MFGKLTKDNFQRQLEEALQGLTDYIRINRDLVPKKLPSTKLEVMKIVVGENWEDSGRGSARDRSLEAYRKAMADVKLTLLRNVFKIALKRSGWVKENPDYLRRIAQAMQNYISSFATRDSRTFIRSIRDNVLTFDHLGEIESIEQLLDKNRDINHPKYNIFYQHPQVGLRTLLDYYAIINPFDEDEPDFTRGPALDSLGALEEGSQLVDWVMEKGKGREIRDKDAFYLASEVQRLEKQYPELEVSDYVPLVRRHLEHYFGFQLGKQEKPSKQEENTTRQRIIYTIVPNSD